MRRSGPPARKKRLHPGGPLTRTKPMPDRSSPIAARSAKMRDLYERPGGRRELVASLLAERPWCEAQLPDCCTGRAVDVHERASRGRGGDILDESILLTVCRACHDWITNYPVEAEALGLAIWSWDYERRDQVG